MHLLSFRLRGLPVTASRDSKVQDMNQDKTAGRRVLFMKLRKLSAFVVVAVLSSSASAQTAGKTRAEVKAETRAAIRSGEIAAPGDSGKTLRERSPERYDPRKPSRKGRNANGPTVAHRQAESR